MRIRPLAVLSVNKRICRKLSLTHWFQRKVDSLRDHRLSAIVSRGWFLQKRVSIVEEANVDQKQKSESRMNKK